MPKKDLITVLVPIFSLFYEIGPSILKFDNFDYSIKYFV